VKKCPYRIVFVRGLFDEGVVCAEFESEHVATHLAVRLNRDGEYYGTMPWKQYFTVVQAKQ
jgi:hypothetical protein